MSELTTKYQPTENLSTSDSFDENTIQTDIPTSDDGFQPAIEQNLLPTNQTPPREKMLKTLLEDVALTVDLLSQKIQTINETFGFGLLNDDVDTPNNMLVQQVGGVGELVKKIQRKIDDLRLLKAAKKGDRDMVIAVLEKGNVDINVQDKNGNTALMWASFFNNVAMVKTLLKYGANKDIRNKEGQTALTMTQTVQIEKLLNPLEKGLMIEVSESYDSDEENLNPFLDDSPATVLKHLENVRYMLYERDENGFVDKSLRAKSDIYGATVNIVMGDTDLREYITKNYDKVYSSLVSGEDTVLIPARLAALYADLSPSGFVRQMLCVLLRKSIEAGYLAPTDYISLEASGEIDGSYLKLVQMYQRMGFNVIASDGLLTNIIEDLETNSEPELDPKVGPFVFMLSTVEKVVSWCQGFKPSLVFKKNLTGGTFAFPPF